MSTFPDDPLSVVDQFYTLPAIAHTCFKKLMVMLDDFTYDVDLFFIEPSAGTGSFYVQLPPTRRLGMDIAPKCPEVIQQDFLEWGDYLPVRRSWVVAVGNPPFGVRGKTAVKFIQHAALFADTIAFIVPAVFRKYSIHKQMPPDYKLALDMDLPYQPSFYTLKGDNTSAYNVNAVFQVWSKLPIGKHDYRIYEAPPIQHPDFTMYQYNNTKEALKVFDSDFDFAVPCQGWQDYKRREVSANKCEREKQWMFFKAHSEKAYDILYNKIDFVQLSVEGATVVPGFRKHDVVAAYKKMEEVD